MHIAIVAAALALLGAAAFGLPSGAAAQGYGMPAGPKLGEMEVKAYQQIPKAKVAVQLTSDTHLSRELRRQVMVRLSQRGNEVGFSGAEVAKFGGELVERATNVGHVERLRLRLFEGHAEVVHRLGEVAVLSAELDDLVVEPRLGALDVVEELVAIGSLDIQCDLELERRGTEVVEPCVFAARARGAGG